MTFDMVYVFGIGMLVGSGLMLLAFWFSVRFIVWVLEHVISDEDHQEYDRTMEME